MSSKTTIEWVRGEDGALGATWNPVRGCVKVSPGCKHCYAETFAERFRGVPGHAYEQGFDPRTAPDQLDAPLHWRKPRTIFVNSMSDLFGEFVPFTYVAAVFGVMAATRQHTYQALTKRAVEMAGFFEWVERRTEEGRALFPEDPPEWRTWQLLYSSARKAGGDVPPHHGGAWPLPNVWLGVSVEDRKYGLPRIEHLRRIPAAVRFLSIEPLLEDLGDIDLTGIGWVIVGGESGPGARPMHPEWVRRIREQCIAAGVPFFFKQWGAWLPAERTGEDRVQLVVAADAKVPKRAAWHRWPDGERSALVGKANAGRLLDGRTWDEMPAGRAAPKATPAKVSLPVVNAGPLFAARTP